MNQILIAEDNPRITGFLETGFQAHGFTTTIVLFDTGFTDGWLVLNTQDLEALEWKSDFGTS